MDLQQFHHITNGEITFTPCFEIVVTSTEPIALAASAFTRYYGLALQQMGSDLRYFKTGTMRSWRRVKKQELQIVPAWLSEPRNLDSGKLGVQIHSGPSEMEQMPPVFRGHFESGMSYLALHLRPDFVSDAPMCAVDLLRTLLDDGFPLATGWAGYAVLWNPGMGSLFGATLRSLMGWLARYPGLGQGDDWALTDRAYHGVCRVNWLTLLGPRFVAAKGGREAFERALGEQIPIHLIGDNMCIQAGIRPEIGDLNRGDTLPHYRRVGAFLRDIRTTMPPRFLAGREDSDGPNVDRDAWASRSEEWLAAFDR